ncbi:LacI family transcriptional regulator [Leucobacter zeae]|nr:LacI family transcriptional regulator [Leucobacter zeae]
MAESTAPRAERTAPRAKRITIRDVAEHLGLSVSTVSAALNGGGTLKEATRQRVREAAAELGYRPSRTALAFRLGRTGTIAYSLPAVDDGTVPMLDVGGYMVGARAAASAAFEAGYALTLTPPTISGEAAWNLIGADGVVLCDPVRGDERLATLERMGIPAVTIERDTSRPDWPYVVTGDHRRNAHTLLDHLRSRGARRIALLVPDASWSSSDDMLTGYREWAEEHGCEPIVQLVPPTLSNHDAYVEACALLESEPRPDAVLAAAEQFRPGVLRACRDLGLEIPDDVLFAIGGDSQAAEFSEPPITAIDFHPGGQSELAVRMLLQLIEGAAVEAPIVSESVLNERRSTAPGGRTPE